MLFKVSHTDTSTTSKIHQRFPLQTPAREASNPSFQTKSTFPCVGVDDLTFPDDSRTRPRRARYVNFCPGLGTAQTWKLGNTSDPLSQVPPYAGNFSREPLSRIYIHLAQNIAHDPAVSHTISPPS